MAYLETGDFAGEPGEAGRYKTSNLIDGMAQIGYSAIGVGERDLSSDIPAFIKQAGKAGLPLTSASFVYRDSGEPLLAPYIIRETKLKGGAKLRIAYLGLSALNSAFAREGEGRRILKMRDPSEAARSIVPELRGRADLVVLLANLSLRDLTTVLSAAPGIDLALASHGARLSPAGQLETISGVPVLYAGDQGKRIGEVRVTVPAKGSPASFAANHVWLTKRYPAEPRLQALIDVTIAKVNEINRANAERLAGGATASPPGAAPERPAPALPGTRRAGGVPTVSDAPKRPFLTVEACASCHAEAAEAYNRSGHSHALATLVKAKQDFNPECLKCHVTGFDQPDGFVNSKITPGLANVQCEACHGNATEHVADVTRPYGDVPPRTCLTCHTKENSPEFVFFKYWDKIKH